MIYVGAGLQSRDLATDVSGLSTDRCDSGELSTVKHPHSFSVKHPHNNPKPSVKHPHIQVVKDQVVKTTSSRSDESADNHAGPKRQNQTLPYRQRTENKRLTANRGAAGKRTRHSKPRIVYAERRVKPLARLLRCATAPAGDSATRLRLRRLVWPKGSLSARPPLQDE